MSDSFYSDYKWNALSSLSRQYVINSDFGKILFLLLDQWPRTLCKV